MPVKTIIHGTIPKRLRPFMDVVHKQFGKKVLSKRPHALMEIEGSEEGIIITVVTDARQMVKEQAEQETKH